MTPSKIQPVLLGGAFIGVLSALPLISAGNLCCCLWVVAGGAIASYIMQQNHPEPILVGDGAVAGFLSGVLGSVIFVIVSVPLNLLIGPMQRRVIDRVLENPEVPAQVRDALANFGLGPLSLVLGFMFMLFAGVVFATIGGILGAVLFKRSTPAPPSLP